MEYEALKAARRVMQDVLELTPGEKVLITRDTPDTIATSAVLASAASEAGASVIEVTIPKAAYPGAGLPALLSAAAQAADVWIELNEVYVEGTREHHEASNAGLRRFYCLSGMTVDDLASLELVDRPALIALGQRLADLATGCEELLVTCRNGSQFRASIRDRVAEVDASLMSLGQTHIYPVQGSARGRLVFDGAAYPPESLGMLRSTITIEFEDGTSRVVSTGRESQLLSAWQASIGNDSIHDLCHVSFGYHPRVPFPTGRLVKDERIFGCLCVGFGPPIPYPFHNDLEILEPTIEIDGQVIEQDGIYVDPEVQRLARAVGAPGY